MTLGAHVRDPIDGSAWFFPRQWEAQLVHDIAVNHRFTFKEVFRMAKLALFQTIEALDDGWFPDHPPTLDELKHDAARLDDAERAKQSPMLSDFAPGLEELLAIRERARRAIAHRLEQETDPVKRLELEALLVPSATWLRIEERLARRRANGKQ